MREEEFDALLRNARLKLTKNEADKIKKDIETVIENFNKLDNISCDDLEPAYQPVQIPGEFRDDKPIEFKDKKELLDNTKTHRFYVIGPEL